MKKSTKAVHNFSDTECAGAIVPIDPSTAYEYIDEGAQPYPRYFNTPNQTAVAAKIAALESADAGLIFGSGMAAISTTITALLKPGDHAVFLNGLYGGSHSFITQELDDRQIAFSFAAKDVASFEAAIRDDTRLIYVESPTNPLLEIVDIRSLASLARRHDIITVIDNTFSSPVNQNPIELGMDVVIHSGTKYLGGHSDLCCGVAVTSQAFMDRIWAKAKLYGGSLNALSVYLLDRSLKTLDVRVKRQTANARLLAQFLDRIESVARVYYPGLESHDGHSVAAAQMHDFGAMIAFELSDRVPATEFLRQLNLIRPAMSLGGVESSACIPAATSHRDLSAEKLQRLGITPQVIRLSVGIEDAEDLKQDLEAATCEARN